MTRRRSERNEEDGRAPGHSFGEDRESARSWSEADNFAREVSLPTAAGIVATISRLVDSGELPAGARLPSVRSLAESLDISVNTVAKAWGLLGDRRLIQTRGRGGTYVAEPGKRFLASRFQQLDSSVDRFPYDLSAGVPDADLLPSLKIALEYIAEQPPVSSYHGPSILPELEDLTRDQLLCYIAPQVVTVVNGAMDGIDILLRMHTGLGGRVVIEQPCFPAIIDLVEASGATAIGVPVDGDGMRPDALAEVIDQDIDAIIIQPRSQNPTGARLTEHRAHELADVLLRAPETLVIEDDHAGDISSSPLCGVATRLPDRTVYIRSFSKSHGPDLRLATVAGPRHIVDKMSTRRRLGASWSSRLLQALLVAMLTDPRTRNTVAEARKAYAMRRAQLTHDLNEAGVPVEGSDGINMWIPVENETEAIVRLAVRGIGVAPGTPFFIGPAFAPHIRVTSGLLREGSAEVATAIAEAARGRNSRERGLGR